MLAARLAVHEAGLGDGGKLMPRAYCASRSCSMRRERKSRDITVPSGQSMTSAISRYLRPSIVDSMKTVRRSGGSSSTAALTGRRRPRARPARAPRATDATSSSIGDSRASISSTESGVLERGLFLPGQAHEDGVEHAEHPGLEVGACLERMEEAPGLEQRLLHRSSARVGSRINRCAVRCRASRCGLTSRSNASTPRSGIRSRLARPPARGGRHHSKRSSAHSIHGALAWTESPAFH